MIDLESINLIQRVTTTHGYEHDHPNWWESVHFSRKLTR